jgi:hypothetical protein
MARELTYRRDTSRESQHLLGRLLVVPGDNLPTYETDHLLAPSGPRCVRASPLLSNSTSNHNAVPVPVPVPVPITSPFIHIHIPVSQQLTHTLLHTRFFLQ